MKRELYKYTVEMYIKSQWVTETRFYSSLKFMDDFDLKPIKNKRRNAKFIEKVES